MNTLGSEAWPGRAGGLPLAGIAWQKNINIIPSRHVSDVSRGWLLGCWQGRSSLSLGRRRRRRLSKRHNYKLGDGATFSVLKNNFYENVELFKAHTLNLFVSPSWGSFVIIWVNQKRVFILETYSHSNGLNKSVSQAYTVICGDKSSHKTPY